MFDTIEEARDCNSKCAFCGLDKFYVSAYESNFRLLRCDIENCTKHCKWTHKGVSITLRTANEDTVAIASGW